MTNPLTNYNVLVIDQTFKKTTSVSFVNTSVLRDGEAHEAVVTAALFDLNDKSNTWGGGGKLAVSQIIEKPLMQVIAISCILAKSGRFNFNVFQELTDTKFTSNDLGYFTNNNY